MKATIIKKAILEDLPSASGMEVINGIIYIVGDNSPYLYKLDHSLKVLEKIELFKSELKDGVIPKAVKPDLECMARLSINNYPHILMMGSGSKSPYRDVACLVKLPTNYNRKHVITNISVADLYNLLRSNHEIINGGELNLEGAAVSQENLILFNRSSSGSKNVALYFNLEEFVEYLQGHTEMTPFPVILDYDLPSISNVRSGFSGADVFDDKLFFTSAVENTTNAIDDGEVFGSFIGWMPVSKVANTKGSVRNKNSIQDTVQLMFDGKPYIGKVESISVYEKDAEKYIALAVTDSDGGDSEILMLEIEL
ncbi:MAG TPA: hypothetical protein VNW99_05785, partial [Cytophagaceae bacterium]|jgi:hypothetical protein|nr:hypothetical protein [Cytophagaceae bacterium]